MDRAVFLRRLEKGNTLVQAALFKLHDSEPSPTGTLEHWSAKDILAHNAAWQKTWVEWLEPVSQNGRLDASGPHDFGPDDDKTNAAFFEANRDRRWQDILAESQKVFGRFLELAPRVPEDDFEDSRRFVWLEGRPLWTRLRSTFYWHPETHVLQEYLKRGDIAGATALAESFSNLVQPEEPDAERAIAAYNLACFYSLVGKPVQAIAGLATAFELSPDLVGFSKQDSDLNPLRNRVDFEDLYKKFER